MLSSCQDVIEVDTPTETPRLSVDALLRIDESKPMTDITIKAGLTSSFFGDIESADLDDIRIVNPDYKPIGAIDQNFVVLTQSESSPGRYVASKNTSFFTDGRLELSIVYGDKRYRASTRYVPTVPIDTLIQGEGGLFTDDETEVLVSFTDDPNRNDFYLFDFDYNEYLVTEDEFYQGQTFEFSYFYDEDVTPGMEISVDLLGVDEGFYNYMNQLTVQAGGSQGPFQTPAATVRGNITRVSDGSVDGTGTPNAFSDKGDFVLGYFAVCQTFTKTIEIE